MSQDEKDEGLVLKSLEFRDRQKIITLFAKHKGIISLIVKGINRKQSHLLTLTSPFTHAEYHYSIGRTDLYRFKDGTPLNTNLALRSNLKHIQAAISMSQALISSQLPGKPAPKLYALILTYLQKLVQFKDPSPLTASFLLKLLKHEGHLALTPHCSQCPNPPTHLHIGEPYCAAHLPSRGHRFTPCEWTTLTTLADARTLKALKETPVSLELQEKITNLFQEKMD